MTLTSSVLLAKLESVRWKYSINTTLQGVNTNLLVKYLIEENAYAIMVSDFASTYFECLIGQQIEQHYHRFNIKSRQLSYQQILVNLAELLQDLRCSNNLSFEKLLVECHTTRINIKTSAVFNAIKMNWNFYIISTEPEIFMKHFSLPLWRGLLHFYRLSKNGDHCSANGESENDTTEKDGSSDAKCHDELVEHDSNFAHLANNFMLDDAMLKQVFR